MPPGLTLGQALALLDRTSPGWLREHSNAWLWNWIEVPFIVRPLWLIPAFLGLICAGNGDDAEYRGRLAKALRRS